MISSATFAASSFVSSLKVPFPVASPINVAIGPKQIIFTQTTTARTIAIAASPLIRNLLPLDILRHAIIITIPITSAAIIPIIYGLHNCNTARTSSISTLIILFFPPLTLSSFSGIISCWHYYNMVIISCRFWHKMQQIWHKILKKVHRTFLSYAWQQKYPEHYNTLGKRIFNSNQFCCTPNTTEPSYFSTALRILFNPKPWFLLSFFVVVIRSSSFLEISASQ